MARILLSAIYCEPDRGSEEGVGWNFAMELTRLGHEVHVLLLERYRAKIEAHIAARPETRFPEFIFVEYPLWMKRLDDRFGVPDQITHLTWQFHVRRYVARNIDVSRYDLIWHVTIGAVRQASLLSGLGVPFVFGPVAGGESAPWKLRANYTPWQHVTEIVRDGLNLVMKVDPFIRRMFREAACIIPRSEETRALLPPHAQARARINIGIGIDGADEQTASGQTFEPGQPLKAVFVGRFLHWKQPLIAIDAFDRFLSGGGSGTLTMFGSGKTEAQARARIAELGREDEISIVSFMPQQDFFAALRASDVFIFPSLHDGAGMALLEAMSFGVPVICFDLGGPSQIVTPESGLVVRSEGLTIDGAVDAFAENLHRVQANPDLRARLRDGAIARAAEFTWDRVVARAVSQIDECLAEQGCALTLGIARADTLPSDKASDAFNA